MKPPRYPRWLNRLYALTLGYFWLPCPLCGTFFGGHEWTSLTAVVPTGIGAGTGICWQCDETGEGIRHMQAFYQGLEGSGLIAEMMLANGSYVVPMYRGLSGPQRLFR